MADKDLTPNMLKLLRKVRTAQSDPNRKGFHGADAHGNTLNACLRRGLLERMPGHENYHPWTARYILTETGRQALEGN